MIALPTSPRLRSPSAISVPHHPDSRWQAVRHSAKAAARAWWLLSGWVPLSRLGLVVLPLLILTARLFTGQNPDMIVWTVCIGGEILFAINVLAVILTAVWLAIRKTPSGESLVLEVGHPRCTGYRLGVVRWNPLVRITVEWEDPPAKATWVSTRGGLEEQVDPVGRCEADQIRRCFTVTDLFGLTRLRVRRRSNVSVISRPYPGRPILYDIRELFKVGDLLGRPTGRPEGDLVEMRRYVPGDPLKLVLWKIYARTGALLVRTPEKAVDPTDRTLAFLVAGPGDEPAAGLARLALEQGLLGRDVVFSADGAPQPARNVEEGVNQIIRSVRFRELGGADLDRFLCQAKAEDTGACVVFVSHQPGPWVAHVVAALTRHPGPFRVVIGVDGIAPERCAGRFGHLILQNSSANLPVAKDIRTVSQAIQATGADVLIVDRLNGQRVDLGVRS